MKNGYVAVLVFLSLISLGAQAESRVIVFDLDGVVLFHPGPDTPQEKLVRGKTNQAAGGDVAARADAYRVADGFPELLVSLAERGYKVHVFSFGNRLRNESVLAGIHLPNGKSALTAVHDTGGKVFSNEDGTNLDPNDKRKVIDTSLPREQRPRIVKNLRNVLGDEARDAILVEDIPANADPAERLGHLVHLPYRWAMEAREGEQVREVKYLEDFRPTRTKLLMDGDFLTLATAEKRFDRLHGRMVYLAGLLDRAEAQANERRTSVREEVMNLQWQREKDGTFRLVDGDPILRDEIVDDSNLLARGERRLNGIGGKSFARRSSDCGLGYGKIMAL